MSESLFTSAQIKIYLLIYNMLHFLPIITH